MRSLGLETEENAQSQLEDMLGKIYTKQDKTLHLSFCVEFIAQPTMYSNTHQGDVFPFVTRSSNPVHQTWCSLRRLNSCRFLTVQTSSRSAMFSSLAS